MRYQLFTPEPDNGVTGNPGEYQPVLEDCQVQQVALGKYHCGTYPQVLAQLLVHVGVDPQVVTQLTVHAHELESTEFN